MLGGSLVADLRRLVGAAGVATDHPSRVAAGTDHITSRGVPGAVVRPASAEQVVAVVAFAAQHGIGLFPRGAGTNLTAGIVPTEDSVVLDLAGMDRILEIDTAARVAIVEPGVINADVKAAVAGAGLTYSPDPASSPISTIGGNIAENAGGPACIKHGVTFHHVIALDVALTDGRLVTLHTDDAVDLLGLLIGSEGTLGVATRAVLNLIELPAAHWTALAAFDRVEDAAETVTEIIAAGILPAALELCDQPAMKVLEAHLPSGYPTSKDAVLFVELAGDADAVARDRPGLEQILRRWDPGLRTAVGEAERTALWAGRLAAGHAMKATGKLFYVCDATVPRQRMPEMIARGREIATRHGLHVITVSHAGDGNVHPVAFYDPDELPTVVAMASEIAEAALDLGGTLTGEHGIGTAKLGQMQRHFRPVELAAFRAVKRTFDPAGVLSPGVMLPPPSPGEPDLPRFAAALAAALAGTTPAAATAEPGDDGAVTVDPENMTVTAGAAVSCRAAAAAAAAHGLACPALERDGLVGELIEGHGNRQPVRGVLLGVDAVLPDGAHARFGSAAIKDVAGLDAKRLVAGGRGAFGRVQRATLRATPRRPDAG
jgi:glycolate oxidase